MHNNNKPIPSSTVILLRQGNISPEVLLVQRHASLHTNGGSWVFPGGKIEAEDFTSSDTELKAAIKGAIRETFEETSVSLTANTFIPFAHWTTPVSAQRRFATWFFLNILNEQVDIIVDGGEIVDYRWLTIDEALQLHRANKLPITPPTFVSFQHLMRFTHCTDIQTYYEQQFAETNKITRFNPVILKSERGRTILYDDDAGYLERDVNNLTHQHRISVGERARKNVRLYWARIEGFVKRKTVLETSGFIVFSILPSSDQSYW